MEKALYGALLSPLALTYVNLSPLAPNVVAAHGQAASAQATSNRAITQQGGPDDSCSGRFAHCLNPPIAQARDKRAAAFPENPKHRAAIWLAEQAPPADIGAGRGEGGSDRPAALSQVRQPWPLRVPCATMARWQRWRCRMARSQRAALPGLEMGPQA